MFSQCNTPNKTLMVMSEHYKIFYDFFQKQTLCDVAFLCDDGKQILSHKVILAAVSPKLLEMFGGDFKESKEIRIPIKNIDSLILKSILTCAYTFQMDIDENNFEELVIASDYLQFNYAKDLCYEYVTKNINVTNCIDFMICTKPIYQKGMFTYSFLYFLKNFQTIMETETQIKEIYDFNIADVVEIIKNDHLLVESEEKIFDFIIEWIKYDIEERSKYLSSLLNNLRLPLVSRVALLRFCDEPLMKSQQDCLINIMKSYLSIDVDENIIKATKRTPHLYKPNIIFAIKEPNLTDDDDSFVMYMDLRRGDDLNWKSCDYSFFCPPRRGATLAFSENGILLAIGGYTPWIRYSGHKWKNYVYELDLTSTLKLWIPTTPMITLRRGFAVATHGRYIYVVGGYDFSGQIINSIEYYDTYSKEWTEVKSMPTARARCGAIVHSDCLYVLGGVGHGKKLSSVECYNIKEERWTTCNPMPLATYVTDITIRENDMYLICSSCHYFIYKMDLNDLKWDMLPTTNKKHYQNVITIKNDLFVVGKGYEYDNVFCERFIAEKNIWQVIESSNKISNYNHIIFLNDERLKTYNIDIL